MVTINDTVAKIIGTHTMKFGFYYGSIINKQPGNEPSAGLIEFGTGHALSTGNLLADMVLGATSNYTENMLQIVRDMGWKEYAFFTQDTWKISRRLTLEYGLRAQHLDPWTARNGIRIAAWVPSLYSPTAPASDFPGLSWNRRTVTCLSPGGTAVRCFGHHAWALPSTYSVKATLCFAGATADSSITIRSLQREQWIYRPACDE